MKVDDCQAQNAILTIAFLAQLIIFFFAPSGARPKRKVEASGVEIMGFHGFPWAQPKDVSHLGFLLIVGF